MSDWMERGKQFPSVPVKEGVPGVLEEVPGYLSFIIVEVVGCGWSQQRSWTH